MVTADPPPTSSSHTDSHSEIPTRRFMALLLGNLLGGVCTFFAAFLAHFYAVTGRYESFAYFPAGLSLGIGYRFGLRYLPGVYLGIIAFNIAQYKLAPLAAAWEAADTIVGTLVTVWGFHRTMRNTDLHTHPRKTLLAFYTYGLFLAPLASVLTSLPIAWITGMVNPDEDFRIHLFTFFLGDAFAILILTPVIVLTGQDFSKLYGPLGAYTQRPREKALWISIGLLLVAFIYFFGERFSYSGIQDILFFLYPMLAWSALRLGVVFTNIGIYIACLAVFTFAKFGLGGTPQPQSLTELLRLSAFMVTIALMAQVISVEALERRLKDTRIVHDALHDWVTDLPNMRHLRETIIGWFLDRKKEENVRDIALGVLIIDYYRTLTESFGFEARNALLQQFAAYIRIEAPESVFVARLYDGDFGLLFRDHTWEQAQEIAQQMATRLATYRFFWEGRAYHLRPTIGLLGFNPRILATSSSNLLTDALGEQPKDETISRLASLAMRPQLSGIVHALDPIITEAQELAWQAHLQRLPLIAHHRTQETEGVSQTRANWLSELQEALRQDRFVLYAQPIVSLSDPDTTTPSAVDTPLRFEVLLRLRRPDGSLIKPDTFLPVAEQLDMISDIDLWVVRNTLKALEDAPHIHQRLAMCTINISGISLAQPGFQDKVATLVQAAEVPEGCVGFEILENAMLSQMEEVRQFSEQMHNLGCTISLDDFGTGLSSFAYLKSMAVDYVKIDGSFVCDLRPETVDYAIVDAIRRVSDHMHIPVVAEWVTTPEVQSYLRTLGIDYGQGFLFGEPMELQKLLNGNAPGSPDGKAFVA